jgi:hypothetical protein
MEGSLLADAARELFLFAPTKLAASLPLPPKTCVLHKSTDFCPPHEGVQPRIRMILRP